MTAKSYFLKQQAYTCFGSLMNKWRCCENDVFQLVANPTKTPTSKVQYLKVYRMQNLCISMPKMCWVGDGNIGFGNLFNIMDQIP